MNLQTNTLYKPEYSSIKTFNFIDFAQVGCKPFTWKNTPKYLECWPNAELTLTPYNQ